MEKVRILEEKTGFMKIEIDEDIGLLNAVAEKLMDIEGIESAAVVKEHPYMEKPKLVVRGNAIKTAIKKAIKMVEQEVEDFAKAVE